MTRHVLQRCPTCGVEHDGPGGRACEACGDTLRPWCSRHGAAAGWLASPACPLCAEEAARPPIPAPRPATTPARQVARLVPPAAPRASSARRRAARGKREARSPLTAVAKRSLQGAAMGGVAAGTAALVVTGAAWAAVIVFGYVGIVIGALLGWGVALFHHPDAPHR